MPWVGFQVARPDVPQQAVVGGPLDVGFAAQGVDAAAGDPHVAQQQLDDGHGADVLGAGGVLGPAHGIHDRTGFAAFTGGAVWIRRPASGLPWMCP
jgi:hypothetical protein